MELSQLSNLESWRLFIFLGLLVSFIGLELRFSRHPRRRRRVIRWPANFSIVLLNSLVLKLAFPVTALLLSAELASQELGVLHWLALPTWLSVLVAVLLLDLLIYWQHRLFHRIPIFWRLHQVHHCDPDYDVSLGLRFHPIEILLSMLIKLAAITILGAPVMAVFIFEVVLNGMAMFNHSNLKLPLKLDRQLRKLLVTPDMHRVHHSVHPHEHHQNFGFNLSVWDRLFHSYRAQPQDGHQGIKFGLKQWSQDADNSRLWSLLSMPFRK